MMRKALVLAVALTLGLVGCTLRPQPFATTGLGLDATGAPTSAASIGTEAAGTPVSQYGMLVLNVRWPERTGYQTALIPDTTAALHISVASGSTILLEQTLTRLAGQASASATIPLKAASNLNVRVRAYREASPDPAVHTAIAEGTAPAINIQPSKNTPANITLTPLFVPRIDSLSTNIGKPGDTLTLTGDNFGEAGMALPIVAINGIRATGTVRPSSTSITVTVPPFVTTGRVVVTSDGVNSSSDPVFWVAKPMQVNSRKEGWDPSPPDDRLVMFGKDMKFNTQPDWAFKFGDDPSQYGQPPLPTWVLTNPAAGTIAADGLFTATASYQTTGVVAQLGSVTATQSVRLVADEPRIASLTPANGALSANWQGGPQTIVTVNGSGFGDRDNPTLRVWLGNTQITNFTRVSDTRITFPLPSSGVGTGAIKALSFGVESTNQPVFQVIQNLNVSPSGITLNLKPGDTYQYSVTAQDTNGNSVASPSVKWELNSSSATMSASGLLTALDYGFVNSPVARTGTLTAWGASVDINYDYNVTSGWGSVSNSVWGLQTEVYYSQSFTLYGTKTFKVIDVPVPLMDASASITMQIRGDDQGKPSASILQSFQLRKVDALLGYIYAMPEELTLGAGTYHMVFRIPGNTPHYLYYFGGAASGVGAAYQASDGLNWGAITTVPPNNPTQLYFRLGE